MTGNLWTDPGCSSWISESSLVSGCFITEGGDDACTDETVVQTNHDRASLSCLRLTKAMNHLYLTISQILRNNLVYKLNRNLFSDSGVSVELSSMPCKRKLCAKLCETSLLEFSTSGSKTSLMRPMSSWILWTSFFRTGSSFKGISLSSIDLWKLSNKAIKTPVEQGWSVGTLERVSLQNLLKSVDILHNEMTLYTLWSLEGR